jgi:hypothetical protein
MTIVGKSKTVTAREVQTAVVSLSLYHPFASSLVEFSSPDQQRLLLPSELSKYSVSEVLQMP